MELLSGHRVIEGKLPRMEQQARCRELMLFPVNGIAKDGGADVVHVDANLVGAAGVEMAKDEGGFRGGIGGERLVIGNRGLAGRRGDHGHFLAVHRVAADVGEDRVLFLGRYTVGDGEVELFHGGALGKLGGEGLVGGVGFRDDEAAGGVLVESVDDAGALDAADAGELAFAVVEQGVDESAVGVAGRGVDDDAVLLMEDEDVFVLVEDIQRNILRCGNIGYGFGKNDGDRVARFHRVAGLGGLAVDEDVLFADQRLDARAGEIGELAGEVCVEPIVVSFG